MNPLISIIIPTYNRAHLIAETLDSVHAQSYTNWECIVVNDGSTDTTNELLVEYCKKDSRFQYFQRPLDRLKGANACRNHGFEVSKGEFIQLLDSDDIMESFCLSERVELLSKNNSIDVLIRDTGLLINSKKQDTSINKDPDSTDRETYLRMFLRYDIPWHTSSALYKREIVNKCKFDENLERFQDVSFNIKVLSTFTELKILRDFKMDTFYRVEEERYLTNEYLHLLIKSLENFNEIHANLATNKFYQNDLRIFNSKFFNGYFLPRIREIKKEIPRLVFSYVKGNIFSWKQKVYLSSCFIFHSTGIIHLKGLGMYRFIKAYNKTFNFE